jgi:hypothetical protein
MGNSFFGKFPVGEIGDNKFDLVIFRPQAFQIGPVVSLHLARGRAFNVEYDLCPRVHVLGRNKTARFDQYLVSAVAELGYEWENVLLSKRLAAGDLYQRAAKPSSLAKISSKLMCSPPVNVYSLSHHTHRMGQPVRRTNEHGRPACDDSPWIERNISVTRKSIEGILTG